MKNSKSSKYLNMGAETSLSVGIFSASASGEHKEDESHRDSETNVTGIQMDVAAARKFTITSVIVRPFVALDRLL